MRPLRRRTLTLALAALLVWPAAAGADTPELAVGQEWSVKDTTAKVVIGRIETLGRFTVVSVSILGAPASRGPINVAHAPFEKTALTASLDTLLATGVAPDANFEQGYQQWKQAQGGFFTLNVAEAITVMLQTIDRAGAPPAPAT